MTELIAARNGTVAYGRNTILRQIDLSVVAGEIVTIVGPNGSGKSTLLRALVGALPIDSGHIYRKPDLRLGYVPQRLHIDPSLPLTVHGFLNLPHRQSDNMIADTLARAGVATLVKRQLSELSGGQFQRIMLARAVINAPELLLLDEPTQALDQTASADFYQHIESLRDELGCAILMVSHELHVVMSATDRVICLNGHICCQGTPDIVSSRPEYRALFGTGTGGALALYRHDHDHTHEASPPHSTHHS